MMAARIERRDIASLMLAFDNEVAPIVGQQVTLDASTSVSRNARMDLLIAAAHWPLASEDGDGFGDGVDP